jgi:aminoglycoside 3-N-acetyltransferase
MYTRRDIEKDIREMGLRAGDSVIVHSSYKSIGGVDGGPFAVIDALADVVLPTGALLFPNLYIPRGFTVDDPPRFDLKGEHVKNLGILPELFKFHYARHFSIHPTHSLMGIGEKARAILADHDKVGLPCGLGTPWAKNARVGGGILLIGVDQRVNTTYHSAEEQMDDPYQLTDEVIIGTVVVDGIDHLVPSKLHVWRYHADFSILNPELEARGLLIRGRIGDAGTMWLDARGFIHLALTKLEQDRAYFIAGQDMERAIRDTRASGCATA